jgi:ABC-type bacteriocin/lantibiotic exporter with double-glycine peptidase domain
MSQPLKSISQSVSQPTSHPGCYSSFALITALSWAFLCAVIWQQCKETLPLSLLLVLVIKLDAGTTIRIIATVYNLSLQKLRYSEVQVSTNCEDAF